MGNMKKEAIDTIKEQSELTTDDLTNYQWEEITDMEDDRLNRRMFMKGKKIIPHICKCCKFFPEGLRDDASPPQELQLNADCLIPYINFVVGGGSIAKVVKKKILMVNAKISYLMQRRMIMDSDIAVIEEYDANRYTWDIIAYIGKDRTGGVLDDTGGTLRIRYLENKVIVDLKHAKGNFRTIVGKGEIPSYWREITESLEKYDEYNFFGVKIKVTKCAVTLGISNELDMEFTVIDKMENLDNFSLWEKELNKHGSLMIERDCLLKENDNEL